MDITKDIKAEEVATSDDDVIDGVNIYREDWEDDEDDENQFVLRNPVIVGIKQIEEE